MRPAARDVDSHVCIAVLCCAVLCCAVLCSAVLCCAVRGGPAPLPPPPRMPAGLWSRAAGSLSHHLVAILPWVTHERAEEAHPICGGRGRGAGPPRTARHDTAQLFVPQNWSQGGVWCYNSLGSARLHLRKWVVIAYTMQFRSRAISLGPEQDIGRQPPVSFICIVAGFALVLSHSTTSKGLCFAAASVILMAKQLSVTGCISTTAPACVRDVCVCQGTSALPSSDRTQACLRGLSRHSSCGQQPARRRPPRSSPSAPRRSHKRFPSLASRMAWATACWSPGTFWADRGPPGGNRSRLAT